MKLHTRLLWILAVLALPLWLLGLVAAVAQISALIRYDPAYFGQPYITSYRTPGAAAKALERALRADDESLLAELQGLRRLRPFEASPSISIVELWESDDWYVTYLFFDELRYQRYLYSFEQVGERWVVVPDDLYYMMRSGRWKQYFLPTAIVSWAVGGVALAASWLLRSSQRLRSWLTRDAESGQLGE